MRPTSAAATTVRALIAAVPDDRLHELFLEFALAALAVPAVEEPKPAPRNGRRRRGRGKGLRRGKGKHKVDRHSRAYLDELNAKRREKRHLAREARAGTAKRRGRKPKDNGSWRAVARELGQLAHRNLAMPADVSPVAAARFLSL
jgi:hypothetical protein